MSGRLIEENLFTKYGIIDSRTPEGQEIHKFLSARAHALAGKYADFENNPVTFVMSNDEEPNAFYAPPRDPDPNKKPKRDRDRPVRSIVNPLDSAVICVTRGLIDMADNLDQLDFVLGHELTHMLMRQHKIERNSKGEEEISDLHAVDLMYDAGADPKQALVMSEKISNYAKTQKSKAFKRRFGRDREEKGVNWSDILAVHMTSNNRKSGIEASLTRLSHLIDARTTTQFDKKVFDHRYSDPVDTFLQERGYDKKKSLGKLKTLIDCIDHISTHVPAESFIRAELAAISQDPKHHHWQTERRREKLQECVDNEYKNYYTGPVIDKKYQQKIANLAEGIVEAVHSERRYKGNDKKPAVINGRDLNVYLHDKAYAHIAANGYPQHDDVNYLQASGVLYSYFQHFLNSHPDRYERRRKSNLEKQELKTTAKPCIELDIEAAQSRIRSAKTAEDFTRAADDLDRLKEILREIRTINRDGFGEDAKLDNLSGISKYGAPDHKSLKPLYETLERGQDIPWNNLIKLAQDNNEIKNRVTEVLGKSGIIDYRLSHGKPYISFKNRSHRVVEGGKTSDEMVLNYELEYAVHENTVLEAYDYIGDYFDNEEDAIKAARETALNITDDDFKTFATKSDRFNNSPIASTKLYKVVSLFNTSPAEDHKDFKSIVRGVHDLIPEDHQDENPIPGSEKIRSGWQEYVAFDFGKDLLEFENRIFKERFGDNFEQDLFAKKLAQKDEMFETILQMLEQAVDRWTETKPKLEALREKDSALLDEIIAASDKAVIDTKYKEREALEPELRFLSSKEDSTHSLIYNLLTSIYDKSKTPWQLDKLTQEQKIKLAEFAVHDEKGVIKTLFHAEGYERFCDYLKILEEQQKRASSGNFELTEMMRHIGEKYDYKHAATKDDLAAFVEKYEGQTYSNDNQKYAWYLHIFDTMRYLQESPDIDVRALATAIIAIEQPEQKNSGADCHEIVSACRRNYRMFIKESDLIALAARAIDHSANYADMSCDDLLVTADTLAKMRERIAKVFSGYSDYDYSSSKKKSEITHDQIKLLKLIDKNIRGITRKAEHVALNKSDALEKMHDLYRIYNPSDEYPATGERKKYVAEIVAKENSYKNLCTLAEAKTFWPEDVLDHARAYVFAKNTFLDDKGFEDKLLNSLLAKLEAAPAGQKKNQALFILLDKKLRAAHPQTRERLFEIYTDDVSQKLGLDDASQTYQSRLGVYLKALPVEAPKTRQSREDRKHHESADLLSRSIGAADKYLLMRRLSDRIISQEKSSQMVKKSCQIKLNSKDMADSYLYGIGVDALTEYMDRDAEMANRFIEFFNSRGQQKNCEDMSVFIEMMMKKKHSKNQKSLDLILDNTTPSNCKILYENFWSAPLEARAVIIARMLKSAVKDAADKEAEVQHSWEKVFDLVMDNLIDPDDNSIEAKYARDIMHSYIKSRSHYERELIMSAMMVANRNIGNDAGNIGKALKLFLENMGPAEIKLGQAIASHPDTPENIRKELQELKKSADVPARWTLYEWIRGENIPEELWKGQYLGKVLGSASYYTTAALGKNKVLRILRPEAREKATKGFKVIRATVDDLNHKEGTSDLSYEDLTLSVQEMVIQADQMSEIETDHDVGQQQYEYAKEIYDGVTISSGGEAFSLKVMDWRTKGKNWIIMDCAVGHTFNDLSDDTFVQREYKRNFAKAYIAFELINILSGKKFDHDRHGAQLSVDPLSGIAGIYDTGAMALKPPSTQDQERLGNILYSVIKLSLSGEDLFASFTRVISDEIEALHNAGEDAKYLVEVKKGLLALGDYMNVLTPEDVKDILLSIDFETDLSPDVRYGITENMSTFERTQYQGFLKIQSSIKSGSVSVKRGKTENVPTRVLKDDTAPQTRYKASWLQDAFSQPDNDDEAPEPPSFLTESYKLRYNKSELVSH